MSKENNNSIKDQVMEQIALKRVTPRPRIYFVLLAATVVLVVILVLGALFFLGSFTISMVRESGNGFLTEFGVRGLRLFLFSLPWILIISALALFFILQYMARRFRFAYRRPALLTLLGVALIALLGSTVLAKTRLHRRALEAADRGRLPVFGKVYRRYGLHHPPQALIGVLKFASGTEYALEAREGGTKVFIISSSTRFRDGVLPEIGDSLFVVGENLSQGFSAFGIRRVSEDEIFLPPRIRGMHRVP